MNELSEIKKYQSRSEQYWISSSDSHLASSEFYDYKKKVLTEILSYIPQVNSALDIGCGNGEYTAMLMSKAETIQAYDISPHLLKEAMDKYRDSKKISFSCLSIDDIPDAKEKYELIVCMGVTSCLIDDEKFIDTIKKIDSWSADNSFIILSDSLSVSSSLLFENETGYVAKYRSCDEYLKIVDGNNMKLIAQIKLMDAFSGKVVNKMFVFNKTKD